MKALIRKYVPLVAMLLLLVLVISFLPTEASNKTSLGFKAPSHTSQEVNLTVR